MKNEHSSLSIGSSETNQWDAGMRASMQVCLADFWDSLEFFWGYEINKKIAAYGFEGRTVMPSEITITLVREERPNKVISHLKSMGLKYEDPYPGVYRFTGGIFSIQILAYGEMDDARWLVMRSMTRDMTPEMRAAVRDALAPFRVHGLKEELLETIIHTYFKANTALFKEGDPMYEWLEPVYKPKMDRIAAESEARGIMLGEARGIMLGEARGIISTMYDMGCGDTDIIDRLMLKLGCDRDAAARMLAEL